MCISSPSPSCRLIHRVRTTLPGHSSRAFGWPRRIQHSISSKARTTRPEQLCQLWQLQQIAITTAPARGFIMSRRCTINPLPDSIDLTSRARNFFGFPRTIPSSPGRWWLGPHRHGSLPAPAYQVATQPTLLYGMRCDWRITGIGGIRGWPHHRRLAVSAPITGWRMSRNEGAMHSVSGILQKLLRRELLLIGALSLSASTRPGTVFPGSSAR